MIDILQKIVDAKKIRLEQEKHLLPLSELREQCRSIRQKPSLKQALLKENSSGIIAELKKASPSRGII